MIQKINAGRKIEFKETMEEMGYELLEKYPYCNFLFKLKNKEIENANKN